MGGSRKAWSLSREGKQTTKGRICYLIIMADILSAAIAGDLSALRDAIRRGEDVNSVHGVSWFVGM